ncbi:uncharacterized protein METZ01_LOCUS451876, partial [marine metagenome]
MSGKNVTLESLEELQEQLLASDMGFETVESIMDVVERHGRDYFLEKVRNLLISTLPNRHVPEKVSNPIIFLIV